MYSGRQPASTALIATFSARTTVFRPAISPSTWSRRSAPPASISAIDFSVGGTTGSPSVQPRSKYASIRLAGSDSPADTSVSYRGAGSRRRLSASRASLAAIDGGTPAREERVDERVLLRRIDGQRGQCQSHSQSRVVTLGARRCSSPVRRMSFVHPHCGLDKPPELRIIGTRLESDAEPIANGSARMCTFREVAGSLG